MFRFFTLLGLVGSLTVLPAPARAADEKGHEMHQMFLDCAKACAQCQIMCDSCLGHCEHLVAAGKKEHLPTLKSCGDCAAICTVASRIVSRGGPMTGIICQACADGCAHCAKECEKFPDDKHMKACAEECRKCEKACREMLKHADQLKH